MPQIYSPAEDSYLLTEVLKNYVAREKIDSVLDMGAGSGIQAKTLIDKNVNPEKIVLVDVNKEVINYLKSKFTKSKIIKSNLFQKIKGKFDLIIFNPPYLPEDKHDKERDTTGGKKGSEIINKFLKQSKKHLNKSGKILLLTSSLTRNINWLDYKKKLVKKKKLFFEELYVWELS